MTVKTGNAAAIRTQEKLLPFLLNPQSYPHHPCRVQLIQTHSSFVLIASPFVYKIKKPVDFGFLDFSTLEQRLHFCEREIFLNRRLAPHTYLGVVPITRRKGSFALEQKGRAIEYAVKMRKLSDRGFLDKRLKRGEIGKPDIDRIASALHAFYDSEIPTPDIEEWGRVSKLKISFDENFRQAEAFINKTISRAAFSAIRFYTDAFFRRNKRLFSSRVARQRIRDCHGDLHLEHIHLTNRHLCIFDCIEFNDRFRYIDVANDIAFLAMDLDYRGRSDLARYFVDRMSQALRDPDMLRLINFYKCYRAFVRGKVESLHSIAHAATEQERAASAERAAQYFRLALQYCVAGSEPLVLIVMGRIGTGKTTLARKLAGELGWPHYSSDRIRKELAGFPLFERTPEAARAKLYAAKATDQTYARLTEAALHEIASRRCVILDATFATREQRGRVQQILAQQKIRFRFIEAAADDRTIKQRLAQRDGQRFEVSDARLENFSALARRYEPPLELLTPDLVRIKTDTSQAQMDAALELLMISEFSAQSW